MNNVKKNNWVALRAPERIYGIKLAFLFLLKLLGDVRGSEFGMLIVLARQISLIIMWLALFAFRSLLPDIDRKIKQSGD